MASLLNRMLAPFAKMAKQPLESFIRLETADDSETLVAEDGSLVTFFQVDGSRQIIGNQEYERIIEQGVIKLGSRFDRPGYALQVVFIRNPDRIGRELRNMMRYNQRAANTIGLDIKDLINERASHLANYMSWEECYFIAWTRPSVMGPTEGKKAKEKRQEKNLKWVSSPNAQRPLAAMDELRTRHRSYVTNMRTALNELGIQSSVLEVHDALGVVRSSLFPSRSGDDWRPILPGDRIPARAPRVPNDFSDVLWPALRHQLCTYDAEIVSPSVVQIGNKLWSAVDVILPPADPTPFSQLLVRFVEAKVPFRISFLIEGGGVQGSYIKQLMATMLTVTNSTNRQIKESIENLAEMAKDEPVVKLRISAATWAPEGRMDLMEERAAILTQALEAWGYCQVSMVSGDPLDEVMSSVPGIACASSAPAAIAPLSEVLKLLPWQRPCSPFKTGPILFRSDDGRIWPYATGSSLTTTWFDLIFAQPGAGKSVLMNTLNIGTVLSQGVSQLPYVAIIDIGPSSSGLISLIKEGLPPERAHEAMHYRLQMSPEYAINPFDTQLGCRRPLPDERSYLIELMTLIATPPGQAQPYDGMPQLVGFVVDEVFRWRDDAAPNAEPRPYLPRVDLVVDEALQSHNIYVAPEAMWWDVVDMLFDRGLHREAMLAQRHAVPTLADAITAARRPQIRSLMEETSIGSSSESVIHAFERMISSAVRELPILSTVTRFDIGETKVCALDLMDVSPQGDDSADRQTAIMYMLARHVMVRSWWINEDVVKYMPERFRPFHELRLRKIKETPKRLCYDEFHRTSKSKAVRSQIIRDVREGRKWGVQIVLSSQLLKDFDNDMVDLATGVWILGSAISDSAVLEAKARFSLSDTAVYVMRNLLTGPRASGAPALLVLGTNEGRYEQFLINTLGPIELWAFSTSADDVALRRRLYTRIGANNARQILAASFPGGSARNEIKRRVDAYADQGDVKKAMASQVTDEIAEELVEKFTRFTMGSIFSQNGTDLDAQQTSGR
ncbi:MAG: IcmB (DotO) protein [Alphaproteobacteria bacterium]|nr:IcmB (DotO) protein [Alphaproteobacteria bacterium]